ncbi:CRISPR-associated endonuclease Cas2 [Desulfovibrio piger]|uniref:CRISPR-associated endonuclease Cas2 n=1 Tax=Desulfovibrio piger TaxID=901 RepID=UPI0034C698BB
MYLVAYDITDDRERRLVSRLLNGYGYSLQRSLYICHIHASQARRMLAALEKLGRRAVSP